METDAEKITKNMMVRHKVQQLREFIEEELDCVHFDAEQKKRFWHDFVPKEKQDEPPITGAMTYEEAKRWAVENLMLFGQYLGYQVINVPPQYFEWLESSPDFRQQLRRYMKSDYYLNVHCKNIKPLSEDETEDHE